MVLLLLKEKDSSLELPRAPCSEFLSEYFVKIPFKRNTHADSSFYVICARKTKKTWVENLALYYAWEKDT